jgi:hypothetical protein
MTPGTVSFFINHLIAAAKAGTKCLLIIYIPAACTTKLIYSSYEGAREQNLEYLPSSNISETYFHCIYLVSFYSIDYNSWLLS